MPQRLSLVIGLAVALGACLIAAAAGTQGPAEPVSAPARGADSVFVGCSGGETGEGYGHTLTRDGQLSAYVKPLREVATHTPIRRDSAATAAVFAALEHIRFRALHFNRVGNMTCFLELTDSEGEHAVTWIKGEPPAALEPVLAALGRAFRDKPRMWP